MTSYHDLEEKTYERIRAKPFTRIHGLVDWTSKEILKGEAQDVAMNCPVSYDWAGTFNLLVMIMGTPRYAAGNLCRGSCAIPGLSVVRVHVAGL